MSTRIAVVSDWSHLRPLLERMGYFEDDGMAHARFETIIRSHEHLLVLASEGDELVGYAWAHDYGPHLRSGQRLARMNDLYVDAPYRRHGHGRALFEHVESWAWARGVRWLQWQSARAALGFYERLGLTGDSCPDPDHPEFEIDFGRA